MTISINKLQKHCLFCDPGIHGQAHQVLLRSDNFYLFAGLGPIVEGYIIITPYRCDAHEFPFKSLSDIDFGLLDELVFLRGIVSEFYRSRYGQPGMHFEHGRAGACIRSNGDTKHCYHAHLCCYPKSFPLWEYMEGLESESLSGLYELSDKVGTCPYLFVEICQVDEDLPVDLATRERWEAKVVVLEEEEKLSSQYLRQLLATQVGQPKLWDWANYPCQAQVEALIENFRDFIRNSGKYETKNEKDGISKIDFVKSVVRSNATGNDYASKKFSKLWSGREQYGAIGKFLGKIPDNKYPRPRILDAGCGAGNYVNAFYHMGLECVGIDVSEKMLNQARELLGAEALLHYGKRKAPPPRIETMDAFSPNFPEQYFDGIWFSAILVHLPRVKAPVALLTLYHILKDDGVLYVSAQIGKGCQVRWEGRVFFFYTDEELQILFRQAGFRVIETWGTETKEGSLGCTQTKVWRHYLLKKHVLDPGLPRLSDLGERGLLGHIQGLLPPVHDAAVVLGVGDDCAALRPPSGELIVVTTDPCPQPVISLLEKVEGNATDRWYDGWFSMIINLSDLASMGARPLGILLCIEAKEDMPVADIERFYEGVKAASNAFDCPILGGNIKDAKRFNCVGTALGAVHPERILRRDAARPDELVVVLGEMGRFWAGVVHKLESIPMPNDESETLMENLKKPRPRIAEGLILAEKGLVRCAMDSSDGLTACFYELARAGHRIEVHIDLSNVEPDPLVAKVAAAADIDVRKLMLSWGNWELVCTVASNKLERLRETMAEVGCPVAVVGFIHEGAGSVLFHDKTGTGLLNYIASERFTKRSYFSHGLQNYLETMRHQPIFHLPCKEK